MDVDEVVDKIYSISLVRNWGFQQHWPVVEVENFETIKIELSKIRRYNDNLGNKKIKGLLGILLVNRIRELVPQANNFTFILNLKKQQHLIIIKKS